LTLPDQQSSTSRVYRGFSKKTRCEPLQQQPSKQVSDREEDQDHDRNHHCNDAEHA
jgi:hypothetical protein